MITIFDFSEFWSASGGGVRRYYLEKIRYYRKQKHGKYYFIMPDSVNATHKVSNNCFIIKVKAFKLPWFGSYRVFINYSFLMRRFRIYKPDIVEIGSPYLAPFLFRLSSLLVGQYPKFVGFWHADFPVTYCGRFFLIFGSFVRRQMEKISWRYASFVYNFMSIIFVSSRMIESRMHKNSVKKTYFLPLGVNTDLFHPNKRDLSIGKAISDFGERPSIFFPHRFCKEKGIHIILKTYKKLSQQSIIPVPILIFAGTGPKEKLIDQAVEKYPHVHRLPFIKNKKDMAKWYASCDCMVSLSGWETFGLSVIESMSSGLPIIGVSSGAILEHIQQSNSGIVTFLNDDESLYKALIWFFTNADREVHKKRARSYAERFTWKSCFKKQFEVYEAIVKRKKKLPRPIDFVNKDE